MTSAHALRGVGTKCFYFFMTAFVFIFVSILLTGVHP